jgi:hypothetical protein
MPTPRLVLCSLLLGAPLLSHAQTAPTLRRYYVGLSAYSSEYQPLSGNYRNGFTLPVQLTLGYQIRPRLAVQVSVAYSGSSYEYADVGKYYTGSGSAASPYAYFEYSGKSSTSMTSIGLLGRYTLTRQPTHHLQFDILGGFTLATRRATDRYTRTDSDSTRAANVTTNSDIHFQQSNLLLTLGGSARYRFGQHLEGVFDMAANSIVLPDRRGTWSPGITGSAALGLRYRFGH